MSFMEYQSTCYEWTVLLFLYDCCKLISINPYNKGYVELFHCQYQVIGNQTGNNCSIALARRFEKRTRLAALKGNSTCSSAHTHCLLQMDRRRRANKILAPPFSHTAAKCASRRLALNKQFGRPRMQTEGTP